MGHQSNGYVFLVFLAHSQVLIIARFKQVLPLRSVSQKKTLVLQIMGPSRKGKPRMSEVMALMSNSFVCLDLFFSFFGGRGMIRYFRNFTTQT